MALALVIGLLAFIAVPSFQGQRGKASLADYTLSGDTLVSREAFEAPPIPEAYPAPELVSISDASPSASAPDMVAEYRDVRKIVMHGDVSMLVRSASATETALANIARRHGGAVFVSNLSRLDNGAYTGAVTLKVPSERFAGAMGDITPLAEEIYTEQVMTEDVTEQFIDLAARLRNMRAEEAALAALLNRSGRLADIIAVTRELARARADIEAMEGRLRFLDDQVAMSTISVSFTETPPPSPIEKWEPVRQVREAFSRFVGALQAFADFLIRLLVLILPMTLIYTITGLAVLYPAWRILKWIAPRVRPGIGPGRDKNDGV